MNDKDESTSPQRFVRGCLMFTVGVFVFGALVFGTCVLMMS